MKQIDILKGVFGHRLMARRVEHTCTNRVCVRYGYMKYNEVI
jgi:hypothetical protein